MEFSAINTEQIEPRIFTTEITIACHYCAQCAECKPIPAEPSGDKLLALVLADERQAIVRLHHLPHPAVGYLRLGQELFHAASQTGIDFLDILFLTRLHIFTAEDRVIVPFAGIDTQIIVWVRSIPKKRLWYGAPGQASAEHITRIQREF